MENMENIQTSQVYSCNSYDLQSVSLVTIDEKIIKPQQTYWWNFDLSFCCCICCMDDD